MKSGFEARVNRTTESLRQLCTERNISDGIDVAVVTGTGLGALSEDLEDAVIIPYSDITDFPHSTAPGHSGALHIGRMGSQRVAVMNGRFHLYEGWSPDDIVLPIYVLAALGTQSLILTNAVGALNDAIHRGDIVMIEDHLNFQGVHALSGPNCDNLGVRFPDLSQAYDTGLRARAVNAAKVVGLPLRSGIYAAVHGPELETNAERRYLRLCGADVVGMSTVIEVIAANHAGLPVLVLSAVTNKATGAPDQVPDKIEDILHQSDTIAPLLRKLIRGIIGSQ